MSADNDERIFLDARRHGVVLARPLAQAVALAAAGGVLLAFWWPAAVVGAALVVAGAVQALRAVWDWERLRLVVTTDRIYVVDGTLRRRARAVRLGKVDSVEVDQSPTGRLLGYGTVVVGPLEIEHVPRPADVTRLVERLAS